MFKGTTITMSIGQPLSQKHQTNLSDENSSEILARLEHGLQKIYTTQLVKYEFMLRVQTRDINLTFHRTLERPLMPLTCDNICIDYGYYQIHKVTVDMDERLVRVYLAPIVIHRLDGIRELESYNQFTEELLEAGWHE